MADNRTLRQKRLANDYQEMQNMRGGVMTWEVVKGTPPFVEEYRIWLNVKTIVGSGPTFRDRHEIIVSLPPSYPIGQPDIRMVTAPPPFHPNWYEKGKWCPGTWVPTESLGYLVQRAIRTIMFDDEITNPNSPANWTASNWYNQNRGRGIFPIKGYALPNPQAAGPSEVDIPPSSSAETPGRLFIRKLVNTPPETQPTSSSPVKRLSIKKD